MINSGQSAFLLLKHPLQETPHRCKQRDISGCRLMNIWIVVFWVMTVITKDSFLKRYRNCCSVRLVTLCSVQSALVGVTAQAERAVNTLSFLSPSQSNACPRSSSTRLMSAYLRYVSIVMGDFFVAVLGYNLFTTYCVGYHFPNRSAAVILFSNCFFIKIRGMYSINICRLKKYIQSVCVCGRMCIYST